MDAQTDTCGFGTIPVGLGSGSRLVPSAPLPGVRSMALSATQVIRPSGIPSGESFGIPTVVQAATAMAHAASQADGRLQDQLGREGYILGGFGAGAVIGQAMGGS